MGGSAGKAGSAAKQYNYYGSLACVVRSGPIDTLYAVVADNKDIWDGPIASTVGNPYAVTLDAKWLYPGGYMNFYWGGQTSADGILSGHPPYRDFSYIAFQWVLFGQGTTNAPNIQIVAEAKPRPPSSIISSTALDNGRANPFAILAELLTSIPGMKLPATKLDATSWQATHDYFASTSTIKDTCYCAPLLDQQVQLKDFTTQLLQYCDGWLRLNSAGKIEAGYYNIDPGSLSNYTTITANDLTDPISLQAQTWDDVPTGVSFTFTDGDHNWVQSGDNVDSIMALNNAAEANRATIDLTHITNRTQATKIATEWVKRNCIPRMKGTIKLRRERAMKPDGVTPLRPGDRFLLDVALEPGGSASLQLCRVNKRRFGATGPMSIEFESEPNQPAVPYVVNYTPPDVESISVTNISSARIIETPTGFATTNLPTIMALIQRPDDLVSGAHVLFASDSGDGLLSELGIQGGFAVPAQIVNNYDQTKGDSDAMRVTLLDTRDQALALQEPGQAAAQNDELLLIVVKPVIQSGESIVNWDDNYFPLYEVFSIVTYAAVSGNTYDFTLYRSRAGTRPILCETTDEVWIIPKASLRRFSHPNFPGFRLSNTTLDIQLRAFSRYAEFEGTLNHFYCRLSSAYDPPSITYTTPTDNPHDITGGTGTTFSPDASINDWSENLIRIEVFSVRQDTGAVTTHLGYSFPPTGSATVQGAFTAAGVSGALVFVRSTGDLFYDLTVRAFDATGSVVDNTVTLRRVGSGTNLAQPTISPAGGQYNNKVSVTITKPAAATSVDYYIKFQGQVKQATVNFTGSSATFTVKGTSNFYIFFRSKNVSITNDFIYVFFQVNHFL